MNEDLFDGDMPSCLRSIAEEVESSRHFEISIKHDPHLSARGMLSHTSTSMTLYVKRFPADPAIVVHELLHARRYFNRRVWFMTLNPDRNFPRSNWSAAYDIDNQIEHLVIQQEMLDECGFTPDDTHVVNDLAVAPSISDPFHRRATLLLNWLLICKFFPEHRPTIDALIAEEGLVEVAATLSSERAAAGDS